MVKINDTIGLLTVRFMLQCAHLYHHENACVFNCTLPIQMICSAIKWFEFEFDTTKTYHNWTQWEGGGQNIVQYFETTSNR